VTNKPSLELTHCLPQLHSRTIFSVSWGLADFVATCSADDSVALLRVVARPQTDTTTPTPTPTPTPTATATASATATTAATGTASDSPAWALVRVLKHVSAHESDVNCVSFHPTDGRVLATAGDDMTIKVWHVPDTVT
jgi:WD40 repeat protein